MKVWQDFIVPILQYCFDYKEDSVKRKILIEDVANIAKLSELDKQEKLGSGELRYKNRIS
jgi:restriction endonuclease Mrr